MTVATSMKMSRQQCNLVLSEAIILSCSRRSMGLNHTAAMLSPEGLKTFVFAPPKLVPKHLSGSLGCVPE